MTESNKARIVKYWLLQQGVVVNMNKMPTNEIDETYDRLMMYSSRIPVKCSIAEVEAVIKALEEYDAVTEVELNIMPHQTQNMDGDFRYYAKQLAELEQLLV